MKGTFKNIIIIGLLAIASHQADAKQDTKRNDFPTHARAEFVFACMHSSGPSQVALMQCSCAIDTIAEAITYDEYEEAETIIRMRQVAGDRVAIFREAERFNKAVDKLKAAQAQSEVECF